MPKKEIIEAEKELKKKKIVKRKLYAKTNSTKGAKSKFDLVNLEIIERTRGGASKKDRIGGLIALITYTEWLQAGELDLSQGIHSQYSLFSINIKEAENKYRQKLRNLIEQHAQNDHKAATWLLERSDPETYKLRDKMDVKQEIEISQKAILEIPDNGRRSLKP